MLAGELFVGRLLPDLAASAGYFLKPCLPFPPLAPALRRFPPRSSATLLVGCPPAGSHTTEHENSRPTMNLPELTWTYLKPEATCFFFSGACTHVRLTLRASRRRHCVRMQWHAMKWYEMLFSLTKPSVRLRIFAHHYLMLYFTILYNTWYFKYLKKSENNWR